MIKQIILIIRMIGKIESQTTNLYMVTYLKRKRKLFDIFKIFPLFYDHDSNNKRNNNF